MIKIIEPGNIFRVKCPVCNCLFQYGADDIIILIIGKNESNVIRCPQCNSKILLRESVCHE